MERVVILGNCQARALALTLIASNAFRSRFEVVFFTAYRIPEQKIKRLHRLVKSAAVVLPQPISNGYRGGIGLDTETICAMAQDAIVVRWPSLYWNGYAPDLCYLRDASGQKVTDGPSPYHDRVILRAFNEGMTVADVCRLLADPDRPSDAAAGAVAGTNELDRRSADCDMNVAPFIAENYRRELLFTTFNHPTDRLLSFVAQQIGKRIGVTDAFRRARPRARPWRRGRSGELLGGSFLPLHANHVRTLGLEFGSQHTAGNAEYRLRGVTVKPVAAVRAYYEYYASNQDLVELNLRPPADVIASD
jgi:hypothetical protein